MKALRIAAVLAMFLLPMAGLQAEELGGDPASFVDIGFGARAMGMGGAYVGLADDSYALTWNPAGLVGMQRDETMLMWTNETVFPYYFVSYAQHLPGHEDQAFGGAVIYSGDSEGVGSEFSLLGGYGISLLPFIPEQIPIRGLDAGSMLRINIPGFNPVNGDVTDASDPSAFGLGLDLGVKCDFNGQNTFGIAIDNILNFMRYNNKLEGSKGTYAEMSPVEVTFGTAIRPASILLLTADWKKTFYEGTPDKGAFGLEFNIADMVYPRIGYAQDIAANARHTYTAGIGIDYRFKRTQGVIFDYALLLNSGEMSNVHRVDISYYWNAKERDRDGDGIGDRDDKCPDDPEDGDGFMDEDGCPEPDNDKDGINDDADRCPNEAEDKDEYQDEDGCPEDDNDLDGVKDASDKCPNKAEDKDGFQDDDGCPDEDNDKDGIKDVDDKCPNDAEDKDGYEDADGCPDLDFDKDGVRDDLDKCPNTPAGTQVDANGCPLKSFKDDDKDGIPDDRDKCPTLKEDLDGFEDQDGCPDLDNDKDGLKDSLDKCPNHPEDVDNFEDDDGCPEIDNDKDGVPDSLDKCPAEKEIINDYKDDDGCPDEKPQEIKKGAKMILRGVKFKSGSAALTDDSYTILNTAFESLEAYPEVVVEVRGYTDSQGKFQYNVNLSQKRAESVRQYLINRGIDPKRLIAKGFGPADPIASNKTRAGRAQNRRIEFHRIK